MCEFESERKKIAELFEWTISASWFDDDRNESALVDLACKCVRDDFCASRSDEIIRTRCEVYVAQCIKARGAHVHRRKRIAQVRGAAV